MIPDLAEEAGLSRDDFTGEFSPEEKREEGRRTRKQTGRSEEEKPARPGAEAPSEGEFILSARFHRFPGHRLKLVEAVELLGPEESLEVNPEDASRLSLGKGDTAVFSLDGKEFSFPVVITPRVPRGQVYLPFDPGFDRAAEFMSRAIAGDPGGWGGRIVKLVKGVKGDV
jgi:anaerobic selenocysteine-containing dehydrogenase